MSEQIKGARVNREQRERGDYDVKGQEIIIKDKRNKGYFISVV